MKKIKIKFLIENDYRILFHNKKLILKLNEKLSLLEAFNIAESHLNRYKNRFAGEYGILTPNIDDIFSQYFDKSTFIIDDIYMNYSLKDISQFIDLNKFWFKIEFTGGIGGDVGRVRKIHFIIHEGETDRHHYPHIHCKCSGEEVVVNLETLEFIGKKFKEKRKNKLVIDNIKRNKKGLLEFWERAQKLESDRNFKMSIIDE